MSNDKARLADNPTNQIRVCTGCGMQSQANAIGDRCWRQASEVSCGGTFQNPIQERPKTMRDTAEQNQAYAAILARFYDNARNNGNSHLSSFEALADWLRAGEDAFLREWNRTAAERDEAVATVVRIVALVERAEKITPPTSFMVAVVPAHTIRTALNDTPWANHG